MQILSSKMNETGYFFSRPDEIVQMEGTTNEINKRKSNNYQLTTDN
jgi:hypothetical protein